MTDTLTLSDGTPLTVEESEREFFKAMAAPEPDEPVAKAPPRTLKPDGEKFGYKADGTPRKSKPGPGRPPKARVDNTTPKEPAKAGQARDYTEDLTGLVQLGFGLLAMSAPADAGALNRAAPGMISAWNAAAQENAYVARGIEWMTKGGVWGAVVVSTMPFALQVAANHKAVEVEKVAALGVVQPEILAGETKQILEAMAAQAQEAQAAA